jgi:hypothetical protein
VTRDQIKRISTLMASLAAELEVVVQEPPPKQLALPSNLLDHAPRLMADLPGWFAALPRSQFDAVWCIAMIDAAACEPYSVRDLAAALHAIRDYPRIDVMPIDPITLPLGESRRPAPAAVKASPPPPAPTPPPAPPSTEPVIVPAPSTDAAETAPQRQMSDFTPGGKSDIAAGPAPAPAEITVSAPPMDPARARELLGTRSGTGERWLKLFGHDLIEIADSLLSPGDPAQEVTILFAPREEHLAVRYGKLLASTGRYEFLRRMGRRPPSLRRLA